MVNGISSITSNLPKTFTGMTTKANGFLGNVDNAADAFFKASATTAKDGALMSAKAPWYIKYANKGPLKYFGKLGNTINNKSVPIIQKVGTKLAAAEAKGGFFSKIAGKLPFLKGIGEKLSKVTKLPGIGTLVTAGTALWGIGKAAKCALSGDFAGAGHQLLKTGGSVVGLVAGTALMATGVGFLPGLALAVGAGFLGDKVGEKVADTVFPSVKARQQQASAEAEMANDPFMQSIGGTDKQFNDKLLQIVNGVN